MQHIRLLAALVTLAGAGLALGLYRRSRHSRSSAARPVPPRACDREGAAQ